MQRHNQTLKAKTALGTSTSFQCSRVFSFNGPQTEDGTQSLDLSQDIGKLSSWWKSKTPKDNLPSEGLTVKKKTKPTHREKEYGILSVFALTVGLGVRCYSL